MKFFPKGQTSLFLGRFGVVFLVIASVYALRGPFGAVKDSRDFSTIYLATTAWLAGQNPYDNRLFEENWLAAGGQPGERPDIKEVPSLYPITTFIFAAPFTFLPWPYAKLLWLAVNCLAFGGQLAILIYLAGPYTAGWRRLFFLAGSVMLYPVHASIGMGQTAILVVFLGLGSILASQCQRPTLAGISLALSLGLKPHLALPFFLYMGLRRRWHELVACLISLGFLIVLCLLPLRGEPSWWGSWMQNLQAASMPGAINDPSPNNILRYHLLNLQYPLSSFFSDKSLVNIIVVMIVLIEAAILLKLYRNYDNPLYNLTVLSTLSLISLFPLYHRVYDGVILTLPIAVIVSLINTPYDRYSRIMLWLMLPIALSFPELIMHFLHSGAIPPRIATSFWMNYLVLPMQVYCLLLMSVVLLSLVGSLGKPDSEAAVIIDR